MYQHILLPTDGSELSKAAIREGVALARALGAKVTVLTVTEPLHAVSPDAAIIADTPEEHAERMAAIAGRYLDDARKIAAIAGVPCETIHVEHDHPYKAIIDTANDRLCDAIFMASHGRRGLSAILLGSETLKVLTHGVTPVIVYRQPHSSVAQRLTETQHGKALGAPDSMAAIL
jgi:nucleotide-binding universal stress UspA family protein